MFITDVTIVTATDTLRAHRSILSAHSPFLAFLLGEQEAFDEDPVLLFPNHSSFVVRMLLQFFYTGEVCNSQMASPDNRAFTGKKNAKSVFDQGGYNDPTRY